MTHAGEVASDIARPVTTALATPGALARFAPIGARSVELTGGFWAERLRVNRERMIPHGFEQLRMAGNLTNLALAAGANGQYRTLGQAIGLDYPFLDTDVYKWLEAVGWELGRRPDPALAASGDEAIELIRSAQRPDGYLNTFVQVVAPGREYQDLAWGHELYSVGHLIQAGVAWNRALGDDRLLDVAVRAADSVDRELGVNGREGIDGHPEVEMALVELYRVTAERRYLDLAARMVELRGTGILGKGRFGSAYWQDHARVAEATSVAGHAVRQLYLDCGAVDVATELGDAALLAAVHRRWQDMVATRTYLTGGVGSRHKDEAFGDPYELPPDRAYNETCGSIASVMLAWRLLLATGDPACADLIERTIYNGVLSGVSLDGDAFFYENPLQRRTVQAAATPGFGERASWYPCACCPPNLMRTLASWEQYQATTDDSGIQVHQYATSTIEATTTAGPVRLGIDTDYPWSGQVNVVVLEAPQDPWSLSLRVPSWAHGSTARDGAGDANPVDAGSPWVSGQRVWRTGETIVLDLATEPRVVAPDPRIDAIRGCVALERGPLVYCIETVDLPDGIELEDVYLPAGARPSPEARPDLGESVIGLNAPAVHRPYAQQAWPYHEPEPMRRPGADPVSIRAIPYYTWANRQVKAMRVWIPEQPDEVGEAPQ